MPIHFWNSRQCHVIQCKTCIHTMATKSPKRTYKDISEMPKGTTWISDLMDCTTTILTAPANHLAPLHRLPLGWRIRIRGVWQTKVWYSWIHLPLHQLWRVSGCYQGTIIIWKIYVVFLKSENILIIHLWYKLIGYKFITISKTKR